EGREDRLSRPGPREHVHGRAAESHDPYAGAAADQDHQRLQQEGGEPEGRDGPPLHAQQLVRFHKTIRCTPAMEAGVVSSPMTVRELVEMAACVRFGGYRRRSTISMVSKAPICAPSPSTRRSR